MDQNIIPSLDLGPNNEPGIACRRCHEQAGRILVGPALRDREYPVLRDRDLRGISTLEFLRIPWSQLGTWAWMSWLASRAPLPRIQIPRPMGMLTNGQYPLSLLLEGSWRNLTRLGLVFALSLKNVEEVGCRGVNLDQILIWLWLRIRISVILSSLGPYFGNIFEQMP